MDVFSMECFIAICNYKNITKAAENLNISQSALSRKVLTMESELGAELLLRRGHSVTPTAAGERLLQDCIKIVNRMQNLKVDLQYMTQTDRINIGYNPEPMMLHALVDKLEMIYHSDLTCTCSLIPTDPQSAVRNLLCGNFDALYAFRSEIEHLPGVDFITLLENDLALLVPQGHRLWNKNKISVADIQDENIIHRGKANRRFRTFSLTTSFLQHLGLGQERFISVNSFTDLVVHVLAGEGLGITAVYDSDFASISKKVKKIILDIPHLDAGDFVFAYRSDDPKISDLVTKLREVLK